MRRLFPLLALSIACLLSANAGAFPYEELGYKGRVVPFYGDPASDRQIKLLEALKRAQLAERMAQITQGTIRLRHDLGVGFESCSTPNAFYSPQRSSVVICLEMIELIATLARDDKELAMTLDRSGFGNLFDGVMWGIFFHELGHAVVDINRVPITGREEDVADQFAFYYAVNFIEPLKVSVVVPTIWFFRALGTNREIATLTYGDVKRLMADEHSLDAQRTYNLACWAFGADESRGLAAAKFVGLPEERGRRCSGEYARLNEGIKSRFKKYLLVKSR